LTAAIDLRQRANAADASVGSLLTLSAGSEHLPASSVGLCTPKIRPTQEIDMFNIKSVFASTAIAALVAAPALALDLSVDAQLGAAPEDMTSVTADESSAFVGNEVRTKDQIVIGQVESVYEGSDGAPVAVITLNSDFGSKSSVKSFTVPLAADTTADGSLTLGWTETELIAAISSNIDPTGPASNETSTEDSGG
jgi:hypothetical protein